jgi:anthranilate synthase component 1
MIFPSYEEYLELAKTARIVPIVQKINGDLFTPISIYQKFGGRPYSFLLESVVGGERWARYSIMGRNPILRFAASHWKTLFIKNGSEYPAELLGSDPIEQLAALTREYESPKFPYLDHFYCGLIGFFGYDFIRYIEDLPDNNTDTIGLPDLDLSAPGEVIVFDHLKNELSVIVNVFSDSGSGEYARAVAKIGAIIDEIQNPAAPDLASVHPESLNFVSQTDKEVFCQSVEKAKAYIRDGDIFQVVLSQRFTADYQGDPLPVYRALRKVNPSPYLFCIELEDAAVVGSSPEMLVRVTDGKIETCPIAGTRPRGRNDAEDKVLEEELLRDEKEISEHYMLVDLARNDVGKVSSIGTVVAKNIGHVEKYSHVMHIVTMSKVPCGRDSPRSTYSPRFFPPEPCPAPRKSARWRSLTNSSPCAAVSTAARSGTSGLTETWIPASRSAPRSSAAAKYTYRPAPESWRIRFPRPSIWKA